MAEGNDTGSSNGGRRRSLPNPFGRIVEAVVPNVVHAIDVDGVVDQIDVDALLARVDLDALVARIDIAALIARVDADELLATIDINALLARVDTEQLLSTVDINALVARVDANELLSTVDVNALVARVDANQLLSTVDIDALIARVDANRLLSTVDVNALLGRVKIDELLARVDIDALAGRLDVDALLARVDMNAIVGSVDMDAVLARVDIDAVIDRVDVDHIMQRADIAGIVAQSTRGITANTIDLVRRQIVGIDELLTRVAARLIRRDPDTDPDGPSALQEVTVVEHPRHARPSISGHYAGPLARVAALSIDMFAVVFMFGIGTAIINWTLDLLFRRDGNYALAAPWATVLFVLWTLAYYIVPLAMTGKTLGKAIVGLRVVTREGHPLRGGQAVIRVLVLPISFALLGLGLIGAVFGPQRRTLHDLAAGSAEVIDWGDRAAALPSPINRWLERRAAPTGPENGSTPTSLS
jgi:uncharacterized RDD family membrane protein YckC